jgi:hypothetical protein
MKIKPEHYEYLRKALANSGLTPESTMRQRWDALYAAKLSPWICANLYDYMNDVHIDTALRAICRGETQNPAVS